MKSQYGKFYNHDPWAEGYDADVQNEENPIRAGYDETLAWVIEKAQIALTDQVLDIGVGTGNLSARIDRCASLTCVDLSSRMFEQAQPKLAHLTNVQFVQDDLLTYITGDVPQFDAIISTYTIHHLTEAEKQLFLGAVVEHLKPGGRAVFGDLMLRDRANEAEMIEYFLTSKTPEVAADIDEEFFWYVDSAVERLTDLVGGGVEVKRFSALSWGIVAQRSVPSVSRIPSGRKGGGEAPHTPPYSQ